MPQVKQGGKKGRKIGRQLRGHVYDGTARRARIQAKISAHGNHAGCQMCSDLTRALEKTRSPFTHRAPGKRWSIKRHIPEWDTASAIQLCKQLEPMFKQHQAEMSKIHDRYATHHGAGNATAA